MHCDTGSMAPPSHLYWNPSRWQSPMVVTSPVSGWIFNTASACAGKP